MNTNCANHSCCDSSLQTTRAVTVPRTTHLDILRNTDEFFICLKRFESNIPDVCSFNAQHVTTKSLISSNSSKLTATITSYQINDVISTSSQRTPGSTKAVVELRSFLLRSVINKSIHPKRPQSFQNCDSNAAQSIKTHRAAI